MDHVFRVFAKDLGTVTLHDSRQRIIDNIETLIMEVETTAEARQVRVQRAYLDPWTGLMCSGAEATLSPPAGRPTVSLAGLTLLRLFLDKLSLATQLPGRPDLSLPEPPCKYCLALNIPQANSHNIGACYQLNDSERRQITVKSVAVQQNYDNPDSFHQGEEEVG